MSADTGELFSAQGGGQVEWREGSSRQRDCVVKSLVEGEHGGKGVLGT